MCSDNAVCRTCEQFGFISHRHVGYHVLVLFLNSGVMEAEERGVGSGGREKAGREEMGKWGGVKEGDGNGKRQGEGGERGRQGGGN